MKNKQTWYQLDVDSLKKIYTFHDDSDTTKWDKFSYSYQPKGLLKLIGKWKGLDVNVAMQQSSVDSIPLNREKIKLITD